MKTREAGMTSSRADAELWMVEPEVVRQIRALSAEGWGERIGSRARWGCRAIRSGDACEEERRRWCRSVLEQGGWTKGCEHGRRSCSGRRLRGMRWWWQSEQRLGEGCALSVEGLDVALEALCQPDVSACAGRHLWACGPHSARTVRASHVASAAVPGATAPSPACASTPVAVIPQAPAASATLTPCANPNQGALHDSRDALDQLVVAHPWSASPPRRLIARWLALESQSAGRALRAYSARSAVMGSTFRARRAGMRLAPMATTTRSTVTEPRVSGS